MGNDCDAEIAEVIKMLRTRGADDDDIAKALHDALEVIKYKNW